jgi:hypothetical protein
MCSKETLRLVEIGAGAYPWSMAAWVPPQPRRYLQCEPFSNSNGNWGDVESGGRLESGPSTARGKFRVQNPTYFCHALSISNHIEGSSGLRR